MLLTGSRKAARDLGYLAGELKRSLIGYLRFSYLVDPFVKTELLRFSLREDTNRGLLIPG